jgi:hypothetical protein
MLLRSGRLQNIPNTTAVRNAKETTAASTLSLILICIGASSGRKEPALQRRSKPTPSRGIYGGFFKVPS